MLKAKEKKSVCIVLLSFIFLVLVGCGSFQKIPERNAVSSDIGILAIPVSLHSTVSTRLLTVSDSIEFRIKALDGSIVSKFVTVKFAHKPGFHFVQLPEGRYLVTGARLVDSNTPVAIGPNGHNVDWVSADIRLTIMSAGITVLPEIYHKNRFRVGTRHYREEVKIYPFEGDKAQKFKDDMAKYKNIEQWKVYWP